MTSRTPLLDRIRERRSAAGTTVRQGPVEDTPLPTRAPESEPWQPPWKRRLAAKDLTGDVL